MESPHLTITEAAFVLRSNYRRVRDAALEGAFPVHKAEGLPVRLTIPVEALPAVAEALGLPEPDAERLRAVLGVEDGAR